MCAGVFCAMRIALAGRSVRVPIENIILPKNCDMNDAMECDFLNEIATERRPSKDLVCDTTKDCDVNNKSRSSSMDAVKALISSGMIPGSMMASFDSFLKNTLRCDMNSIPSTQGQGMLSNICNNSSIYPYKVASNSMARPSMSMAGSFPLGYYQRPQDPRCVPNGGGVPPTTKTIYVPVATFPAQLPTYPPVQSRTPLAYPPISSAQLPTYPPAQPRAPLIYPPMQSPTLAPMYPSIQQISSVQAQVPANMNPQCYSQGMTQSIHQIPTLTGRWSTYSPTSSMVPADSRVLGYSSQLEAQMTDSMMQAGVGSVRRPRSKGKRKRRRSIVIKCICLKAKTGLEDCKCEEDYSGKV